MSGGSPGRDALHPADQHLGVDAVDVHARAVDVEVAQRHVVQPVHVVEAAQQPLVERSWPRRRACGCCTGWSSRWSGSRRPARRPTPTTRRRPCARRPATAASSTLKVPSTSTSSASRGSSAHCVMRIAAWWKTTSMPCDRACHQVPGRGCRRRQTHSARPPRRARFSRRPRTKLSRTTISPAPASHQLVDDVRADEARAAGDQCARTAQRCMSHA